MHEISIEMMARRFDRASLRRGNSVLPAFAPQASTARDALRVFLPGHDETGRSVSAAQRKS